MAIQKSLFQFKFVNLFSITVCVFYPLGTRIIFLLSSPHTPTNSQYGTVCNQYFPVCDQVDFFSLFLSV